MDHLEQMFDLLLQVLEIALGVVQLIAENTQTALARCDRQGAAHRPLPTRSAFRRFAVHSDPDTLVQELAQRHRISLPHRLSTWIGFEHPQGRWSAGIGEDLAEFGKEHDQQRMQFVFVADHIITELLLQPHQFSVGAHLLVRDIPKARFAAEQGPCNGRRIQPVRLARRPRC